MQLLQFLHTSLKSKRTQQELQANLAGLKVQKLLAEPTAAAIAYGVDNLKAGDSKTVMIYDFGGGTFDLSILNIVDGQYMEAGTGGDRWLGGDDWIENCMKFLWKVADQYNIGNIKEMIDNLPSKEKYPLREKLEYKPNLQNSIKWI